MRPLPGLSGGSELEAPILQHGGRPAINVYVLLCIYLDFSISAELCHQNLLSFCLERRSRACGPRGPFPRPANTFHVRVVSPPLFLRFSERVNRNRHAELALNTVHFDHDFDIAGRNVVAKQQVDLVEAGEPRG